MVRIKERYLLVNIIYPFYPSKSTSDTLPAVVVHHQPTTESLTSQLLLRAIRDEVATLFGDYGRGAFEGSLHVKYLSLATSTIILRCNRAHYQMLWTALTFMDRVPVNDGRRCIFRVVRVSGTIRKIEEEAIRQAKRLILAAKDQEASTKQPSFFHAPEPTMTTTTTTMTTTELVTNVDSSDEEMDSAG